MRGFSLVELMIVVAIVGVLAAIAIPNFARMQARAKLAEVFVNVEGVGAAALAAVHVGIADGVAAPNPSSEPGKELRDWGDPVDWRPIAYQPDGQVRCTYLAAWSAPAGAWVEAVCNVDGDDLFALLEGDWDRGVRKESTNAGPPFAICVDAYPGVKVADTVPGQDCF